MMKNYIVKIKDLEIPYCIKNYKKSKSIKVYFKDDILTVTKSPYVPIRIAEELIYSNANIIYDQYKKILENEGTKKSNWHDGQIILYKGEEYIIKNNFIEGNILQVQVNQQEKEFNVYMPAQCEAKQDIYIKRVVLQLLKKNTEKILKEKLPYWSKKVNIDYDYFKVRDAKTKYGSCLPSKRILYFTSRLVMLKEEAIDAVIVHELCHMIYANHSKDFYDLVEKYIPNYKEIDKYLKECSSYIRM